MKYVEVLYSSPDSGRLLIATERGDLLVVEVVKDLGAI